MDAKRGRELDEIVWGSQNPAPNQGAGTGGTGSSIPAPNGAIVPERLPITAPKYNI